MLFNPLRRARITLALHYLRCYPPTRRFLGLVIPRVLPYPTSWGTRVGWKYRSLFPGCERRRMDWFFWHHLPTRDLLVYNIIILHLDTPLIIIGVEDVVFNRLCSCHVFCHCPRHATLRTMGTWLVYVHHLILLYTHTSIVLHTRIQTTFRIRTCSIHPPSNAILPRIISTRILYHTPGL